MAILLLDFGSVERRTVDIIRRPAEKLVWFFAVGIAADSYRSEKGTNLDHGSMDHRLQRLGDPVGCANQMDDL